MACIQRVTLISWIICVCMHVEVHASSENILSAFHDQLLNAKVNLTKSLRQIVKAKRETDPINVSWNQQWGESIENSNSAFMRYGSNKIFILSKDTVYNLNNEIATFKLIPILSLQDISSQVKFIESIEWENILFLLLGLNNGQCRLMTATNKLDFTFRQTISNLNNPVDAEFFILDNQLFVIIVLNNLDDTKAATRIYRWSETHLDEEPTNHIRTIGAISATSFTYKESVMLIIGQVFKDKYQVSSQILKMKSNGVIEKVQFLPTREPVSIKHFKIDNENFIFVLEKNKPSTIYWWEGKAFVVWLSLPTIFGDFTLSVGYARGSTLIIFYKENIVTVYTMSWQELHKVTTIGFHGEVVTAALYDDKNTLFLVVVTKTEVMGTENMIVEMYKLTGDFINAAPDAFPQSFTKKPDRVGQCMKELENSVNFVEDNLRYLKQTLPNILYDNKPTVIQSNIKLVGPYSSVHIETGEIKEVLLQNNDVTLKKQLVNENIVDVSNKIEVLARKIQHETLNKSKTLIFEKDLFIEKAKINSIKTEVINNNLFNPNEFISVTDDQRLKATIISPSISIKWLVTDFINDKKVEHLALKDNIIKRAQTLDNLHCNNMDLLLPFINEINITNLATIKKNITLKGEAIVEDLVVEDLKTHAINKEVNVESLLNLTRSKSTGKLQLLDDTYIHNINVKEINDINIDNLINNLVLTGQNNTISGKLFFSSGFQVNTLAIKKLNGEVLRSSDYTSTLNFKDYERVNKKRDLNTQESLITRRKIIVKGKVKIEGDLYVNKLFFNNTVLCVNNHSLQIMMTKIDNIFWNKQSSQTVILPVTFNKGAVVHGDLDIKRVNGYELSFYNDTNDMNSNLIFQNVTVKQFIKSSNSKALDFRVLNSSIVRKEGKYYINGKKVFSKHLQVKNLKTSLINDIPPNQAFILKDTAVTNWDNLVVSNLFVKGDINTNLLNKVNVSEEFQNIILSHKNYSLESVQFTNLSGNTVNIQRLNDMNFSELQSIFTLTGDQYQLQIHFDGNLNVSTILSTKSINGKILADLIPSVVNRSNPFAIRGKKTFKSQVTIENDLTMSSLNSEVVQKFFDTRLLKSKQQSITGFYTMEKCKIGNLSTEVIDGVNFNDLVFINDPNIVIKSDIKIQDLTMYSNVSAVNLINGCILPKVGDALIFTNKINWSSLHVDKDVHWQSSLLKGIQKIIDFAVLKDKNQTISGNVVFNTSLTIDNLQAEHINNLNISFIFEDAVMKNKLNQIIFGQKEFTKKIRCSFGKVFKEVNIPIINKINITELNKKIIKYNTDSVVTGHKTFKNGLKSFNFTCEDGVNQIKPSYIVTETSENVQPHAVFKSLEVIEDLHVGKVNKLNLTDFSKNIVMLKSKHPQTIKGQFLFKKSVQLSGQSTTKSINSIRIEDTLSTYNFQKHPQNIYGCTNFITPVLLKGDFSIDTINGKSLSKTYETAVLDDGNYSIQGTVVFDKEQNVRSVKGNKYFSGGKQLVFLNESFENNNAHIYDHFN